MSNESKEFDISTIDVSKNTILSPKKGTEYFSVLAEKLLDLSFIKDEGDIAAKIKTLLRIPEFTNEPHVWQGIAELLVWFYFESKKQDYSVEVGKNKNCDISLAFNDVTINIEVKCPNPKFSTSDEKILRGRYLHRTLQPFSDVKAVMSEVKSLFEAGIKNQGLEAQYDGVVTELPDDNPLFQSIVDAHLQLPELDDKTINIVFVPTTRNQMESYWAALTNDQQGIFAIPNPFIRGQGNNPWTLDASSIKNISAVVLSDAIERNAMYNGDSWSLDKCFNLVLVNMNSAYYKKHAENQKYVEILYSVICNQTKEFVEELTKSIERWKVSVSEEWRKRCQEHIDSDPNFKSYSKEMQAFALTELMCRFQPDISREALEMAHGQLFMDYCSSRLK